MSEFTKGEWIAKWSNSDHVEIRSDKALNKPICDLSGYYYGKLVTNFEELSANATIIAHAPKMLDMLKYFVENNMLSHKGDEMAKQLIQQATTI